MEAEYHLVSLMGLDIGRTEHATTHTGFSQKK